MLPLLNERLFDHSLTRTNENENQPSTHQSIELSKEELAREEVREWNVRMSTFKQHREVVMSRGRLRSRKVTGHWTRQSEREEASTASTGSHAKRVHKLGNNELEALLVPLKVGQAPIVSCIENGKSANPHNQISTKPVSYTMQKVLDGREGRPISAQLFRHQTLSSKLKAERPHSACEVKTYKSKDGFTTSIQRLQPSRVSSAVKRSSAIDMDLGINVDMPGSTALCVQVRFLEENVDEDLTAMQGSPSLGSWSVNDQDSDQESSMESPSDFENEQVLDH